MKKHNESKSIKGIRRSKGNILCKVFSFTMAFVMLFCISASAEQTIITVKDQNGNIIQIETELTITERDIGSGIIATTKKFTIENVENNTFNYTLRYSGSGTIKATIIKTENNEINISYTEFPNQNYINLSQTIINNNNGEEIISVNNGATSQEVYEKWIEIITPLKNNDFSEYIIVYIEPPTPAYESFLDKARAMFGLFIEMVIDTFNWLVSPTVIPFFLIGTALSLIFIGIIICKRLFWGR